MAQADSQRFDVILIDDSSGEEPSPKIAGAMGQPSTGVPRQLLASHQFATEAGQRCGPLLQVAPANGRPPAKAVKRAGSSLPLDPASNTTYKRLSLAVAQPSENNVQTAASGADIAPWSTKQPQLQPTTTPQLPQLPQPPLLPPMPLLPQQPQQPRQYQPGQTCTTSSSLEGCVVAPDDFGAGPASFPCLQPPPGPPQAPEPVPGVSLAAGTDLDPDWQLAMQLAVDEMDGTQLPSPQRQTQFRDKPMTPVAEAASSKQMGNGFIPWAWKQEARLRGIEAADAAMAWRLQESYHVKLAGLEPSSMYDGKGKCSASGEEQNHHARQQLSATFTAPTAQGAGGCAQPAFPVSVQRQVGDKCAARSTAGFKEKEEEGRCAFADAQAFRDTFSATLFPTQKRGADDSASAESAPRLANQLPFPLPAVTRRQTLEQNAMWQTTSGRAVLFCQAVCALEVPVAEAQAGTRRLAEDEMVDMATKLFEMQRRFREEGRPSEVTIAWHYTNIKALEGIRENGLMSKVELRKAGVKVRGHGATYGPGVYTATDPRHFRGYGEVCLLLAVLRGHEARVCAGSAPNPEGLYNSVIGNKRLERGSTPHGGSTANPGPPGRPGRTAMASKAPPQLPPLGHAVPSCAGDHPADEVVLQSSDQVVPVFVVGRPRKGCWSEQQLRDLIRVYFTN